MKISLINITKSFEEKKVFDSFSCDFEDNGITVIKGESGVGKTTLLRITAGLDKDFTGRITPEKYSVSFAFQEPRLFPGAAVLENLTAVSEKDRALLLLEKIGIGKESLFLYPDELSGGMAKRVSVARALLFDADVYLLDEPFSGLDEENICNTAKAIREYVSGKTCVVVTHNSAAAEILSGNIINL